MDIEKILKDTIETSESIKANAEKMLTELNSECDRLALLPEQYAREFSLSKWGRQLKNIYFGTYKLYDILRDLIPSFADNWVLKKGESKRKYGEEIKIALYFEDGFPIVKTPLLHRRLPENVFRKGYSNYFTREIENYLYRINYLPKNGDIIIYALANYHNSCAARDNDNPQTKKIIDALSDFFPKKDSGFHCAYYSTSISNTAIEEGTYFVIKDKKDSIKSDEELQEIILKYTKNEIAETKMNAAKNM